MREIVPLDEQSTEDALAALDADERETVYRLLRKLCGEGEER